MQYATVRQDTQHNTSDSYDIKSIKLNHSSPSYTTRNLGQSPVWSCLKLYVRLWSQVRGLKYSSPHRHLTNAITLAYTKCAVFIFGGYTAVVY